MFLEGNQRKLQSELIVDCCIYCPIIFHHYINIIVVITLLLYHHWLLRLFVICKSEVMFHLFMAGSI